MGLFADIIRDSRPRPNRQTPVTPAQSQTPDLPGAVWPEAAPVDPVVGSVQPVPVPAPGEVTQTKHGMPAETVRATEPPEAAPVDPVVGSEQPVPAPAPGEIMRNKHGMPPETVREAEPLVATPPGTEAETGFLTVPPEETGPVFHEVETGAAPHEPPRLVRELPVMRSQSETLESEARDTARSEPMPVRQSVIAEPPPPAPARSQTGRTPEPVHVETPVQPAQGQPQPVPRQSTGALVPSPQPETAAPESEQAPVLSAAPTPAPVQAAAPARTPRISADEPPTAPTAARPLMDSVVPPSGPAQPRESQAEPFARVLQDTLETAAGEHRTVPLGERPPGLPLPPPVNTPTPQNRRPAEPRVHIGQIDVVVVAAQPKQGPTPAAGPGGHGFSSRHYLRSL